MEKDWIDGISKGMNEINQILEDEGKTKEVKEEISYTLRGRMALAYRGLFLMVNAVEKDEVMAREIVLNEVFTVGLRSMLKSSKEVLGEM